MINIEADLIRALKRYNFQSKFEKNSNEQLLTIRYEHVDSCLQNGPQCGLVALAMLCIGSPKVSIVSELLSEAYRMKFTLSGEIFSADHLKILAMKFLPHYSTISMFCGYFDCDYVYKHLMDAGLALIAYKFRFFSDFLILNLPPFFSSVIIIVILT